MQRTAAVVTAEDAIAMLEPGDVLIDCTGSKSLLRDHLVPGAGEADGGANTLKIRLEYALVITFLYGQPYDCNESLQVLQEHRERAATSSFRWCTERTTTAASAT